MPATEIHEYRDALRAIWLRSAYDRGFISNPFWGDAAADLGLRRTEALLGLLDDPHRRCGIVHVAGSKGKGSTCAFVASITHEADYKTGLFTSPHLHSFRERIAVNGVPISESDFTTLTRKTVAAAERLEGERADLGEVTAFELSTAMAFRHFADTDCDLGVIEVGLGGTFDATNVVDPAVAIITALDYEHTRVLGSTLAGIAANKAGIIKADKPVVSLAQEPEALEVIEAVAREQRSDLYLEGRDWAGHGDWRDFAVSSPGGSFDHLRLGLAGDHQVQNASAAVIATQILGTQGYTIPEIAVRRGLESATWPGRFEIVRLPNRPKFILDGAHTPASARVLVKTVLTEDSNSRRVVVLGMMSDKDPVSFARELAAVASVFIATASRSPRAAAASDVLAGIHAAHCSAKSAPSVAEALSLAQSEAGTGGTVIVTGSLSTVAEAREALGLAVGDPPVEA